MERAKNLNADSFVLSSSESSEPNENYNFGSRQSILIYRQQSGNTSNFVFNELIFKSIL